MSNPFSENPVETVEQWNNLLCCCAMPVSYVTPILDHSNANARVSFAFPITIDGEPAGVVRYNSGFFTGRPYGKNEYDNGGMSAILDVTGKSTESIPTNLTTTEFGEGDTPPPNGEIEILETTDQAARSAYMTELINDAIWLETSAGVIVNGSGNLEMRPFYTSGEKRRCRYRWNVPSSHVGSYYKITWDIIEEPSGWNSSPPTASRSFVAQNLVWEWTGPGDTGDPASWQSDWYYLDPPSVLGQRRIVNRRYERHRGPFGSKPHKYNDQITEAQL